MATLTQAVRQRKISLRCGAVRAVLLVCRLFRRELVGRGLVVRSSWPSLQTPGIAMRELFSDLCDLFPYCLLVALPVFIALSPGNPVAAAAAASAGGGDFVAHRAAHFELGGGAGAIGAKVAAMSLEARAVARGGGGSSGGGGGGGGGGGTQNVLRKVVVAKLQGEGSHVNVICL